MKKNFLFAIALVALSVSCEDVPDNMEPNENGIPINISLSPLSKVSGDSFENGDMVGLYVSNFVNGESEILQTSGNYVDNAKFTKNAEGWSPEKQLFWEDNTTPADFYAYYPYDEIEDVTAHQFSVLSNQSTLENQNASYFLIGKVTGVSPTDKPIVIETKHMMSSLNIYFNFDESLSEEEITTYNIRNVRVNVQTDAVINLSTGEIRGVGYHNGIIPYYDGTCYKAVVVPQTQTIDDGLISFTANGVEYSIGYDISLLPNTQHNLTVTIRKDKVNSNVSFSLGSWEVDTEEYMGSVNIHNIDMSIEFNDPYAKAYCIRYYDTNKDGELSYREAASVESLELLSIDNQYIECLSFDELRYFTSLRIFGGEGGPYTTFNNTSITQIHIPCSVEEVWNYYSEFGREIGVVYFYSIVPPSFHTSDYDDEADSVNATIYVPQGCLDAYKAACPDLSDHMVEYR